MGRVVLVTPASSVQAVIFDCFGVLTSSGWMEFQATLDPDHVQAARALNYQADAGQISEDRYLEGLSEITGRDVEDIRINVLEQSGDKNLPLLRYIAELKKHFKIGLLSNVASDWIQTTFLTNDELALFDDVILSYQVRLTKPDARIFHLAAERLGVPVETCVFIDDGPLNCQGAAKVGMLPIEYLHFTDFKKRFEALI